eukprot:748413-Rhodomonas_salina.2
MQGNTIDLVQTNLEDLCPWPLGQVTKGSEKDFPSAARRTFSFSFHSSHAAATADRSNMWTSGSQRERHLVHGIRLCGSFGPSIDRSGFRLQRQRSKTVMIVSTSSVSSFFLYLPCRCQNESITTTQRRFLLLAEVELDLFQLFLAHFEHIPWDSLFLQARKF